MEGKHDRRRNRFDRRSHGGRVGVYDGRGSSSQRSQLVFELLDSPKQFSFAPGLLHLGRSFRKGYHADRGLGLGNLFRLHTLRRNIRIIDDTFRVHPSIEIRRCGPAGEREQHEARAGENPEDPTQVLTDHSPFYARTPDADGQQL